VFVWSGFAEEKRTWLSKQVEGAQSRF
jgi:hypothetical protein